MTAKGNLLARKEKLLRQLEDGSSDGQRDEIESQIAQIDTALDLLEALGARTDHKKRSARQLRLQCPRNKALPESLLRRPLPRRSSTSRRCPHDFR